MKWNIFAGTLVLGFCLCTQQSFGFELLDRAGRRVSPPRRGFLVDLQAARPFLPGGGNGARRTFAQCGVARARQRVLEAVVPE